MADTYGDIQTRIANELNRTDLTAEIKDAIQSAIAYYAAEHFYFNEKRAYRLTVDGREYYGLPDDFVDMVIMTVTVTGNYTYKLNPRTHAYIEELNTNQSWKSRPTEFALWNDQVRIYPIPNGTYTLNLSYQAVLDTLAVNADTNAWVKVKDAEELIRQRAKVDLLENIIRGRDAEVDIARYQKREFIALERLRSETTLRLTSNTLKPTAW